MVFDESKGKYFLLKGKKSPLHIDKNGKRISKYDVQVTGIVDFKKRESISIDRDLPHLSVSKSIGNKGGFPYKIQALPLLTKSISPHHYIKEGSKSRRPKKLSFKKMMDFSSIYQTQAPGAEMPEINKKEPTLLHAKSSQNFYSSQTERKTKSTLRTCQSQTHTGNIPWTSKMSPEK